MSVYEENETLRILNSLCDVSLDKFNDRLRLQKLGYLSQVLGASGGFTFSWYLRGPYSSTLTKTLYGAEEVGLLGKKQTLKDEEKKIVTNLKKLLGNKLDSPHLLELYASVWYLLPKRNVSKEDKQYVLDTFENEKPDFSKNDVKKCIENILKFKKQIGI